MAASLDTPQSSVYTSPRPSRAARSSRCAMAAGLNSLNHQARSGRYYKPCFWVTAMNRVCSAIALFPSIDGEG